MKRINWGLLAISIFTPFTAGILGSAFTTPAVQSWYQTIYRPTWNPPSWLFGPVWTLLYILMGVALYLVWSKKQTKGKNLAMSIFLVQLILNAFWSVIFFGLGNFWFAFVEIVFLWLFIVLTIAQFWKINKTASLLLLPYILWVSFAAFLNFTIATLN